MWGRGRSNIRQRTNTGRLNTGDEMYTRYIAEPTALSWEGRLWFLSHYVDAVAGEGGTTYFSFTTPSDRYVAVYTRDITVTNYLWFANVVRDFDSYTPGTTISPRNSFLSQTENTSNLVVTSGVTDIVGGTTDQQEPIPGDQSNNGGGATARGASPIIYPPGLDILLKLTNNGNNPAGAYMHLVYAEFADYELPDGVFGVL